VWSESEKTSIKKEIELHCIAKEKKTKKWCSYRTTTPIAYQMNSHTTDEKSNFKNAGVFRLKHYTNSSGIEV
jgi:hypothetical protein